MATVYQARDRTLRRQVAIKILDLRLVSVSSDAKRFLREGRIAAQLRHPNIVTVFDFGVDADTYYIVMELVTGGSLNDMLLACSSPVAVETAIDITIQVAQGLEYAHKQGVVHRDLKPSNILLGDDNRVMLSDFGLAQVHAGPMDISRTIYAPVFLGTPQYSAPEQWSGSAQSPRTDIYSLGAVLYKMLTLNTPLKGASLTELAYLSLNEQPKSIQAVNKNVTSALESVVLKALAKQPADRYDSALAFAEALQQVTKGIPPESLWAEWQRAIAERLLKKGTLRAADLSDLPGEFRQYALARFINENSQHRIVFSKDLSRVSLIDPEPVMALMNKWSVATERQTRPAAVSAILKAFKLELDDGRTFLAATTSIARSFATLLGTPLLGEARLDGRFVSGIALDTTELLDSLNLPARLPCIFARDEPRSQEWPEADVVRLRNLATERLSLHQRLALLFVLHGDDESVDRIRETVCRRLRATHALDIIALGQSDMIRLLLSKDTAHALRRLILRFVDLISVSPFVTTGPAPDVVFFGREPEMREITEHARSASFAVIAGRRMGKSSLLTRLHRVRFAAAGLASIYHDCSTTPTYHDFMAASIVDWRAESPAVASLTFESLLSAPPPAQGLVLLLDEADKLIPYDRANGWKLFSKLRALSHSGSFQLVLSGERKLREALQDSSGPLFNFANQIVLGPLDYRAVQELVTRPLQQLDIELSDADAIVNQVWEYTSGHPNIVQRLCRRLIELLNEDASRRVTPDVVAAVVANPKFREEDFLGTYWERATPLEQIISLLMAQSVRSYRLYEVMELLAHHAIAAEAVVTKAALDRLVDLRSLLKHTQNGYEFAVPAFPKIIANSITAEDMLIVLRSQYQVNPLELA